MGSSGSERLFFFSSQPLTVIVITLHFFSHEQRFNHQWWQSLKVDSIEERGNVSMFDIFFNREQDAAQSLDIKFKVRSRGNKRIVEPR